MAMAAALSDLLAFAHSVFSAADATQLATANTADIAAADAGAVASRNHSILRGSPARVQFASRVHTSLRYELQIGHFDHAVAA
jgi:hypothetical protein